MPSLLVLQPHPSIKPYEEALRQAAQAFIHDKEEAESAYHKANMKATEICNSDIEKARISRNEGIEQCRQFIAE